MITIVRNRSDVLKLRGELRRPYGDAIQLKEWDKLFPPEYPSAVVAEIRSHNNSCWDTLHVAHITREMKNLTSTFYQLVSRNAISEEIETKAQGLEYLSNWIRNPNLKSTRLYKVTRTDKYEEVKSQRQKIQNGGVK